MKKITLIPILVFLLRNQCLAQLTLPEITTTVNAGAFNYSSTNGGIFVFNPVGPAFFINDEPDKNMIGSSALWLGGLDENGHLHLSAATYGQKGYDYFPGYVSKDSSAVSQKYNAIYHVNQSDIDENTSNPGGSVAVNKWPAIGGTSVNETPFLAPFFDKNKNNLYEPKNGDYPLIRGEVTDFTVFNDNGVHTESGGKRIMAEVKSMVYSFKSNGVLDSTFFVHFSITNKSANMYHNFYCGAFTDFDIGNFADDLVGCDASRNMYFGYNGKSNDAGNAGFGLNVPAVGVMFLNHKLKTFKSISNSGINLNGDPGNAAEYYNIMSGRFKDSSAVKDMSGNISTLEFSGDVNSSSAWNAKNAGIAPTDFRGVGSAGPFTFKPGETICFDIAYFYGRGKDNLDAVSVIQKMADSIQIKFDNGQLSNGFNLCDGQIFNSFKSARQLELKVNPNPANEVISVQLSETRNSDAKITLFDQLGKLVSEKTISMHDNLDVAISYLSKGIYTIVVDLDDVSYRGRFIKN